MDTAARFVMATKSPKKTKPQSTSSPLRGMLSNYWSESARPWVSLVFVTPMLVAYEAGLVMLGPRAMRNGADVWLRQLLDGLGFSQYFLLPILTCAMLLGWHHLNRERWTFRWTYLYGMVIESLCLAFLLVLLAQMQQHLVVSLAEPTSPTLNLRNVQNMGRMLAFLGAGIYEEALFRVMLFPAIAAVLRVAGSPPRLSWVLAIVLSSLLFAAAHYQLDLMLGGFRFVTSVGDKFDWTSFLFRFGAGVFFASLMLARGFGVAAGTHAFYDIIVSLPN